MFMWKRAFLLTSVTSLFAVLAESQCPAPGLWSRLHSMELEHQEPGTELKKLVNILDSVKRCHYSEDSTHSFLLARIASIYRAKGDFLNSVQVYKEAIKILANNQRSASTNMTHLPGRYFWLSVAYDSLNNFTEKMKALDSCFTISIRLKYQDRSTLTALALW